MTKQDIINELARLYRLREEGKEVETLIIRLEAELCDLIECEEED